MCMGGESVPTWRKRGDKGALGLAKIYTRVKRGICEEGRAGWKIDVVM